MELHTLKRTIGIGGIVVLGFMVGARRSNEQALVDNKQDPSIGQGDSIEAAKRKSLTLKTATTKNKEAIPKDGQGAIELTTIRTNAKETAVSDREISGLLYKLGGFASQLPAVSEMTDAEKVALFYKAEVIKEVAFDKQDMPEVYEFGNWISTYIGGAIRGTDKMDQRTFDENIERIADIARNKWEESLN